MTLNNIIKNSLTVTALSTLLLGCSPKKSAPIPQYMTNHECPSEEQLLFYQEDLKELTYVSTLEYVIEENDTARELAKNLSTLAEIRFGQEIIPLKYNDILEAADVSEDKLPVGEKIFLFIYRPPTPLDQYNAEIMAKHGDKERFNYLISH